jgi:hypothetical protein
MKTVKAKKGKNLPIDLLIIACLENRLTTCKINTIFKIIGNLSIKFSRRLSEKKFPTAKKVLH